MYHSEESADTKTAAQNAPAIVAKRSLSYFRPAFVSGVVSMVLITSMSGCTKVVTGETVWENMSATAPANDNNSEGSCIDDDAPVSPHCR